MSLVTVSNVEMGDNPARFTHPITMTITFECHNPGFEGELEWKLTYVGSGENPEYDQELDSVLVGPVAIGMNKFVFTAEAPDPELIPPHDLLEVTVLLLTCSYKDKEFIRVGYYVTNEYSADYLSQFPTFNPETPHSHLPLSLDHICRNILADKPRVTRFAINWNAPNPTLWPGGAHLSANNLLAGESDLNDSGSLTAMDDDFMTGDPDNPDFTDSGDSSFIDEAQAAQLEMQALRRSISQQAAHEGGESEEHSSPLRFGSPFGKLQFSSPVSRTMSGMEF